MTTTITSNGNLHVITGLATSETSDALPVNKLGGVVGAVAIDSLSGGTVTIQVSLDNTNWYTLKDPFGTEMAFTSDQYAEINTAGAWLRASANSSVTSVNVSFILRN